ncbi:hypothetical protein JCM1840_001805 [Sporobolomyces johnsonii]
MTAPQDEHVLILGAGIVGLCSAYYALAASPSTRVTLVEASASHRVAAGASSHAGGFLACGPAWHDSPSRDLARLTWECHVELAKQLKGEESYGWRECGAVGLSVGGRGESRSKYRSLPRGRGTELVETEEGRMMPPGEWVEGEREELSTEGGVGQVDPAQFCQTLHRYLETTFADRFDTRFGEATSISRPSSSRLSTATDAVLASSSASTKSTLTFLPHPSPSSPSSTPPPIQLPFDKLLITAGPWSAALCAKLGLPSIPISNLPGHSLLIRPALDAFVPSQSARSLSRKELPSEAVFAGIDGAIGGMHSEAFGLARGLTPEEKAQGFTRSPELFIRKNGLVYVAGENSIPDSAARGSGGALENKLPGTVDQVEGMVDQECVGRLKRAAGAVSPLLKEENGAVVERMQLCYRPISSDREPSSGGSTTTSLSRQGMDLGLTTDQLLLPPALLPLLVIQGITLAPGTGKVIAEMMLGLELSADVSGLSPARFRMGKA